MTWLHYCFYLQSAWRDVSPVIREIFLVANCTPWNTSCLFQFAVNLVEKEQSLFPIVPSLSHAGRELWRDLVLASVQQDATALVGTLRRRYAALTVFALC